MTNAKPPLISMVAGACIISFSSVLVNVSGVEASSSAFYRLLFGGITVALIAFMRREFRFGSQNSLVYAFVSSIFFCIDLVTWHIGIPYLGPGLATLIANFQVFFLAGYDIFAKNRRLSPVFIFAVFMAVAGLYLLVGHGWEAQSENFQKGVFFCLVTAASYAGFMIFLKKSMAAEGSMSIAQTMLTVSVYCSVMLGIYTYAKGGTLFIPTGESFLALLAYGILCHGLGWYLVTWSISKLYLSVVGLILLLQPTLSFFWDVLIFNKSFTPLDIAGAMLALTAIYIGTAVKR